MGLSWGSEMYLSQGRFNAGGTAILHNSMLEYSICNQHIDEDGNLLVLEINDFNIYDFILVNLYGPNKDNPVFFQSVADLISKFDWEFVIIAGDFNLVQDTTLDYFGGVGSKRII